MQKRKEVVWASAAEDDVVKIVRYLIEHESEEYARRMAVDIQEAGERLSYQALLWRARDNVFPGARFVLMKPYIIVYDVRDDDVNIVRVLHGAQNIEAILQTEDEPNI